MKRRGISRTSPPASETSPTIRSNLASFVEADQGLRKAIQLSREIGNKHQEAIRHRDWDDWEAYQGRFNESSSELETAFSSLRDRGTEHRRGVVWAYQANERC